jgi:hypothetical protein
MRTTTSARRGARSRVFAIAASALAAVTLAPDVIGNAEAAEEPSQAAPAGPLAVSYTAPPPSLVLTPYASIPIPVGSETEANVPEVAVLPDGGAVVVDRPTGAYLVGSNGARSGAIPLEVTPTHIVATAGPVVYGFIPRADLAGVSVGAIALEGPNIGRVVARGNPDSVAWIELPIGAVGNAPSGVVGRVRDPGAHLIGHVDINGSPVTVGGLRGILTITESNLVTDEADPTHTWQLSIQRHPEAPAPYTGESPPSPGANGTSVYWTSVGPAARPSEDFSPALQHVIAVLQPDGSGQWYSIPEGWSVASSDVGGTIFVRRLDAQTVELARLDTSATGPAPQPIPALAAQCDDYAFNNQYPLRRCDSGAAVRIAQQQLRATIDPALQPDGFFGPLTDRAVRRFQQANGLEVDGLVGRNTWRALTEGKVEGSDADGSGLIDPWELQQAAANGFPPANTNLTHGGTTWALVLAGSADFEDPALGHAAAVASDAGYTTGPTDCDIGAPQALGIDSEIVYTVSVYYATEADARAAQAAFAARDLPGVVTQVQTMCLD